MSSWKRQEEAKACPVLLIDRVRCTFFVDTEQHALLVPGRVPGYSQSDLQLLPSNMSKRSVWRAYRAAAEADGMIHPLAYTTSLEDTGTIGWGDETTL